MWKPLGKVRFSSAAVDKTVLELLYNKDIIEDRMPVKTSGDGNCLFNAVSLALFGTESFATELRLRTALELLLNCEFYGEHPVVKEKQVELSNRMGRKWSLRGLYNGIMFSNSVLEMESGDFQLALQA